VQYINPSWIGSRGYRLIFRNVVDSNWFHIISIFWDGVQVWVSNYYYVVLNFQISSTSPQELRLIPTDSYLEMWFNNKGSIKISIIGLSLIESYMVMLT
jgi:hypothetical protein